MSLIFEQLEKLDIPDSVKNEQENDPDYVLKKVAAAFNLCWELPQVVLDRLFSATASTIDVEDRGKLRDALLAAFEIKQQNFEATKYFAFPRFRCNVCLKVLTAFIKEDRVFVAIFATEARPVDCCCQTELDKTLPAGVDLPFAFALKLSHDNREVVFYMSQFDSDHPLVATSLAFGLTPGWLQYGLVKKISSWLNNPEFEVAPSDQPRSMRLVDPEIYLATYLTMKESIGSYWIKNWPERTDPQKFVYEELAIAAYLLTILRQSKECSKTTFADLGCGNGFLTYALNNAKISDLSISGIGIDARRRKIWNIYPEMTEKLVEAPVSADNLELFSGAEWFIGNHSDELTPWIPYIASKCGPNSKVFLLPCCPFDFHSKYQRRVAGKSLYGGYLDYIERLCVLCGFVVQRDRLRIPSTKRVCFICTKRAELSDEVAVKYRQELAQFVTAKNVEKDLISPPLPKAQEVRNCTAIAPDLKQLILSELFDQLVNKCTEDVQVITLKNGVKWRAGGRLPLHEAAERLSAKSIDALKDQDGGLKTFTKNHSHVFAVVNGCVYFKPHPTAVQFLASRRRVKKSAPTTKPPLLSPATTPEKPCWFEQHHPDGCPYWPVGDVCRSLHRNDDDKKNNANQ